MALHVRCIYEAPQQTFYGSITWTVEDLVNVSFSLSLIYFKRHLRRVKYVWENFIQLPLQNTGNGLVICNHSIYIYTHTVLFFNL
jgi:hypothetical protein